MKKYTKRILFLIGILLITGCKPNTSNEQGKTNLPEQETIGSVQKEFKPMAEQEIKTLIQDRLLKAERANQIIKGHGIQIDKSQSIDIPLDEQNTASFYLVNDEKIKSIADIEKILQETFTQRAISYNYKGMLFGTFAKLVEKDGKLYIENRDGIKISPKSNLVWDIENLEVGYQSEERIVVYAKATEFGYITQGKIALQFENGKWLLDTNSYLSDSVPYERNYALEKENNFEKAINLRKELVDYAGQEKNGYRLPKPISEYVTELEEYPAHIVDNDLNSHDYYEMNIYSVEKGKLKLQDKMFLPKDAKEKAAVLPSLNENGLLQLNYSYAPKEENIAALGGYVSFGAMDDDMFLNLGYNFSETSTRDRGGHSVFPSKEGAIIILPKYYGTTITLTKNDKIFYQIKDELVLIGKNDGFDTITIQYQDKEISFKPIFDGKSDIYGLSKIIYKYPEALG